MVMKFRSISKDLIEMVKVDQQVIGDTHKFSGAREENATKLQAIIDKIGWPTISKVGKKASTCAWLIAQHADLHIEFQEMCLSLMKCESDTEVKKADMAFLEDRVRVNRGEEQIYGTQLYLDKKTNSYVPRPIKDSANVDFRRKEVGLDELNHYLEEVNKKAKRRQDLTELFIREKL